MSTKTKNRFVRRVRLAAVLLSCPAWFAPAWAGDAETPDLTELSLEALMNVEVTSVAKREQPLAETAAAAYVITREEIRRSGMTSIPELLRMVPGLQVARIDANKWAISSRGFLSRFSNKMLVLVDGRSVYTPLFAGVYWDVQDTVLEDIERIEVIRGPGATLWGANAVNGVINIVTRDAADTHGGLVTAVGGTHETQGMVRYGGRAGSMNWRAFGRYVDHSGFVTPFGSDAEDPYDVSRAGFRFDWGSGESRQITVQGEAYSGDAREATVLPVLGPPYGMPAAGDIDIEGHNVLVRWQQDVSDTSSFSLQAYYDKTRRDELRGGESRDTFDLDFHQRTVLGSHDLVWGVGFRHTSDEIMNSTITSFSPSERDDTLFSAFVQDDFTFNNGDSRLTFGIKFEQNDYTGFEFQPNVRMFHKLGERHSIWAAVSRAVRSPARAFEDAVVLIAAFPDPLASTTTAISYEGNPNIDSEDLLAYEFGYRCVGDENVSLDIALFRNHYENLNSIEMGLPRIELLPVFHVVIPQVFDNQASGTSNGIEISTQYRPFKRWKLFFGYTWLDLDLDVDATSTDTTTALESGNSAEHQFQVRSYWDLGRNWTLDVAAFQVDDLPNLAIDAYTRVDVRAGWTPNDRLELSVAVRNLTDDEHAEFTDFLVLPVLVERSAIASVTWSF